MRPAQRDRVVITKHITCGGENDCKGQGGCDATPGENDCKGQGHCHVSLMDGA